MDFPVQQNSVMKMCWILTQHFFIKHEYAFINLEHRHELSENSDVSDSESDDNQDNDVQVNE